MIFHQRPQLASSTVGPGWPLSGFDPVNFGLVSWWAFSEGSGLTAADSGPIHNTATITNAAIWGTGNIFPFGGDVARAPDHGSYNFGTAMTAFMWLKGAASVGRFAFTQYDFATPNRAWFIGSDMTSGIALRVGLSNDGSSSVFKDYTGSATILDNTNWHSVGFTWGSSTLKLYVDGVLDTVSAMTANSTFSSIFNSTADICFGDILNGGTVSGSGAMNASMQQARLYNIEKSPSDMAAIHALGHA